MGINGWYMNENDENYSSYTDFTAMNAEPQVISRPKSKKVVRKTARRCSKKKSSAGKVLVTIVGAMAIAAVSISGTWFYLTEIKDNDEVKSAISLKADSNDLIGDFFAGNDTDAEYSADKEVSVKTDKKNNNRSFAVGSGPAYDIAEDILSSLWCDNDVDTAWEIFNWVHSNIYYQTVTEEMSYEDAAYRGFTRRSGDCYVYYSCAKMLLDCAGIPNMMIERYPVYTNGHYWNLVQLDGEWYHCDATVFKDHPGLYFMCTDDEIADDHHEFDSSLYPERASGYSGFNGGFQPGEAYDEYYADAYFDPYTDYYDGYYDEYNDGYYNDYNEYYDGYGDWENADVYVGEGGWY